MYKLYIWEEDVLTNYTSGMAVAAAESVEEARDVLVRQAPWEGSLLARDIAGEPDRILELPAGVHCWGGA